MAEDDSSVRLTIEFVLEDEGFEVLLAEDGEQALNMARETVPDAILLDQMMPKLDGKEVYRELRDDPATREIPVFVLTGMSRGSGEGWEGAYFVGKPFNPDELIERIRKVLADA